MYPSLRANFTISSRALCTVFLLAALAFFPLAARAQSLSFTLAGTYPMAVSSPQVVIADLNGDGKPDLVVYGSSEGTPPPISVLINKGDGTFNAPIVYNVNNSPAFLLTGDFNGDGFPDVAYLDTSGALNIMLNKGDGSGTLLPPVTYPAAFAGADGQGLAVGDFIGNGHQDVAVLFGNPVQATEIATYINNGDGTFGTPRITSFSPVSFDDEGNFITGDVNNDGKLDIVVQSDGSDTYTFLGNGDGTFEAPKTIPSNALDFEWPFLADFNYDDKLDLFMLTDSSDSAILLGNGDGTFENPIAVPFSSSGADIENVAAFADFNADGKLDFVTAQDSTFSNPNLEIFEGNGDGTFPTSQSVAATGAEGIEFVATADLDGDGSPDLVAADFSNPGNIFVLLNNAQTGIGVTASRNPVELGQTVDFTATVTSSLGTPSGTVQFFDGKSSLATETLNNSGQAILPAVSLGLGNHTITAQFNGGSKFGSPVSSPIYEEVLVPGVAVSLTTSSNPAYVGQQLTLTSSVLGGKAAAPTGTITFYNGGTSLGTATVQPNGQASINASFPSAGSYTLTAVYSGDANYPNSSSPTLDQIVISITAPTISSVTPSQAQEGSPNLPITITGTNFFNTDIVEFNGSAIATSYVSSKVMDATIPASDLAEPGNFPIIVNDPVNQFQSTPYSFAVIDAPLTATGTTFTAETNLPFTGTVATFTDGDVNAPVSDFTQTSIVWGDGTDDTPGTITSNGNGNFTVTGTHTYTSVGVYSVRVHIVDIGGSAALAITTGTVTPGPPPPPRNLVASAISPTQIALVWGASTGAVNYSIERENNGAFSQIASVNGSMTTYTDSGLTPNTTYTYRVRASNAIGFSLYSNQASATTPNTVLTTFPTGLQMISLPFSYAGLADDASVILGLSVVPGGTAAIATWNPSQMSYLLYPNLPGVGTQTLAGVGYWINEPQVTPFYAAGNAAANPFNEALQPGWNMIGDPFTSAVTWSNAEFSVNFTVARQPAGTHLTLAQVEQAHIIDRPLYDYSTTTKDYAEATSLLPYVGDWVYVDPNFSNNQPIMLWLTNPGS